MLTNEKLTKRKFFIASAFGLIGLNAAVPSLAFAGTLEELDSPQRYAKTPARLSLGDTSKSVFQHEDGSCSTVCNTSILPAAPSRTTNDKISNDPYATVRVTIDYTFSRGKIAVTSGSVYISDRGWGRVVTASPDRRTRAIHDRWDEYS